MVLGTYSRKDRLYDAAYSVIGTGDLGEQLRAAIERLPAGQVMQSDAERPNPPPTAPAFTPPPPLPHIAEGSFFVGEDKVIRQV
jgi:hypothetical protein